MNTLVRPLNDVRRTLDIDLVADFTCPWSWLGMAQLTRALGNLSGDVETRLRWHPFRMAPRAVARRSAQLPRLPRRAPAGGHQRAVRGEEPHGSRARAGLEFHFEKLGPLPSTSEAHRLVQLATEEGRHANVAAAIFRAYFERGADIADVTVLAGTRRRRPACRRPRCRSFATRAPATTRWRAARSGCAAFGVRTVPNLLFGGRVLVPGTVNVATYVHALDQALFPSANEDEAQQQPTLH